MLAVTSSFAKVPCAPNVMAQISPHVSPGRVA
jgi:hypothetical protein